MARVTNSAYNAMKPGILTRFRMQLRVRGKSGSGFNNGVGRKTGSLQVLVPGSGFSDLNVLEFWLPDLNIEQETISAAIYALTLSK